MKRSKSPCIGVCEFSHQNHWCLGCGRTRKECQQWKAMKPYARNIFLKELHKRMVQIKKKTKNSLIGLQRSEWSQELTLNTSDSKPQQN